MTWKLKRIHKRTKKLHGYYLQDVINEGFKFSSEEEAKYYASALSSTEFNEYFYEVEEILNENIR